VIVDWGIGFMVSTMTFNVPHPRRGADDER
jgi:hypothetical protein